MTDEPLADTRAQRILDSKPDPIERFFWWLAPQIDKVWRRTIRLQRTRFCWIPHSISRSSDYVSAWAAWRLMARCARAGNKSGARS